MMPAATCVRGRWSIDTTREHGCHVYHAPVSTGRVGKENIFVQCFLPTRAVFTGARYTLPEFTGRVDGYVDRRP